MKVIEFFGMPRTGKTEQIKNLSNYLKNKKIRHFIITDREVEKEINIPFERAFEYSLLFYNKIFDKLLHAIQSKKYDLIILDRGFLDSGVWFNIEFKKNHLTQEEKNIADDYMRKLRQYIDFGILFIIDTKTALERHEKKGEKEKSDEYVLNNYFHQLGYEYASLKDKLKNNKKILIIEGIKSKEEIFSMISNSLEQKQII